MSCLRKQRSSARRDFGKSVWQSHESTPYAEAAGRLHLQVLLQLWRKNFCRRRRETILGLALGAPANFFRGLHIPPGESQGERPGANRTCGAVDVSKPKPRASRYRSVHAKVARDPTSSWEPQPKCLPNFLSNLLSYGLWVSLWKLIYGQTFFMAEEEKVARLHCRGAARSDIWENIEISSMAKANNGPSIFSSFVIEQTVCGESTTAAGGRR